MKDFKDVKQGDWIFTIGSGWAKVKEINNDVGFPVKVADNSFTYEGKDYHDYKHPSAWTYDPFKGTKPPCEFKVGQVVAFWDSDPKDIGYRRFREYADSFYIDEHGTNWENARALNDEELNGRDSG